MNAVEELEQAIATLEQLADAQLMMPDFYDGLSAWKEWQASCRRIVTLHRTLDAQLAILRRSADYAHAGLAGDLPDAALNLARAINGESGGSE